LHAVSPSSFSFACPRLPLSPLFPYTTLFRSAVHRGWHRPSPPDSRRCSITARFSRGRPLRATFVSPRIRRRHHSRAHSSWTSGNGTHLCSHPRPKDRSYLSWHSGQGHWINHDEGRCINHGAEHHNHN